ncbi:SRPBCC family protein [Kitasatospora aureofaciens]|uniref:SRPBCC family protein n=1 Tax=Kitasatospora aureofaciens TaxID=1894 RepID=UPI0033DE0856
MARFVLTRLSPLPPADCWARLTAWPRHGDRVPFTRVSVVRGTGRQPGDVILARTALGPLRFDDPMELVELVAPMHCLLAKRGRVVRGGAELRIRAVGAGTVGAGSTVGAGTVGAGSTVGAGTVGAGSEVGAGTVGAGSEVVWAEELRITGLPRLFDPAVALAGRLVFGRVLDHLLATPPASATG